MTSVVVDAPSRKLRISQPKLFQSVGFHPHSGQRAVLEDDTRFKVCSAGRRFGKSEIGGHQLLTPAFEAYYRRVELEDTKKRMEYWIVGPNYSDSEKEFRVLYNELKKLEVPFDRPGTYNDPIGGNLHISLWDGRFQVHGKSASHPESLVGEGLHGAIVAEAAKVKERVWTRFIRPTLNDYKGWTLMTSTPEGKNWFYDMWRRGQDPNNPSWASWRMPGWVNPHVYPGGATDEAIAELRVAMTREPLSDMLCERLSLDTEVAQLVADLTAPTFNQEIAALFTEFVGRVFKDFDEEVHVGDLKFDPEWTTYACVDYGFTNPNVWILLQVDPFGARINILDELYESGLTAEEFAEEIKSRGLCPGGTRAFYPDPASPGDTRILEQRLKIRGKGGTGGELKYRIDAIRNALKQQHPHLVEGHPERRPIMMIDRKCTATIHDFLEYRYPDRKDEQDKNAPENPVKKDDHAPEALGRFFAGHFMTPEKQARRAKVSSSTMRRS